jgi:hypothetical protein
MIWAKRGRLWRQTLKRQQTGLLLRV